ncbi:SMI1/KNR4 family protein [Metasolibacillus meyeri]|uniref:SMI1/KNR4 family protein n=1 Tax=Metasolibacillus meyeri TaxID=1071052 RepID=UPI000D301B3C|nr:SMI1/KNR4 family protein [Metasolibacillus meyeri]
MLYVEKGEALQTISFFQPPLTEPELAEWEQQLGFSLPSDYRLLLKFTNGMKIFQLLMDNVNIGGGSLALAKYNSIEQM